ncbi:hypothetical protein [Oscillatoria salina]|uniref:hypothetical protein n=1 Tax=Oscillatoria salina TaxID=331517 RepID=UPI0013B6AB7B|nr:hypothetical protein [Oscillatoria salina]MBZ8180718.1 hypothetical protein [Oscillatoria salina IIICB1]NET87585.1 hypothetical protein [Kamptonema sp. SIO1D9]
MKLWQLKRNLMVRATMASPTRFAPQHIYFYYPLTRSLLARLKIYKIVITRICSENQP